MTTPATMSPTSNGDAPVVPEPRTRWPSIFRPSWLNSGARGIDSVVVEGGPQLAWAAVQSGSVDLLQAYIAPRLFGGEGAPSPVAGDGVDDPIEALRLSSPRITRLGDDLLLECEVV